MTTGRRFWRLAAGLRAGELPGDEFAHAGAGSFERALLAPTQDLRRVFMHDDVVIDVPDAGCAAGDLSPEPMATDAQSWLTRLLGEGTHFYTDFSTSGE